MTTSLPVLESLLDEYPSIAYRCLNDAHWTMQYVSPGVEALTGYPPGDFTGARRQAFAHLIHPDDRERVRREIDQALAAGTGFALAYRLLTSCGSTRFVEEHGNAIRCEDGRVVALQGFVKDVSAARQMQRELAQVTERFRWIAQATNDHIWDWNLETDEIWHGKNVRGVFALPSDASLPSSDCWSRLIHPADRDWVLGSIAAAVAGCGLEWSAEYRLQRIDGSYADVHDRAFLLRDANGKATRMVGGVSDLTERKQSRLRMERLNRALRIMQSCGELLVHADDENDFLHDICRAVVDMGGYAAAWFDLAADGDAGQLRPGACYPRDIPRVGLGHADCSAADARMGSVRDQLLGAGYHSGIWLALTQGSRQLGVLALFSKEDAGFDAEEIQLLQRLAENIAFGIEAIRSHQERKRIESAAVKIVAGVSAGMGTDFFSQFTRNMAQAVDADGAFVARFKDERLHSAETLVALVNDELGENFEYQLAGSPCEQLVKSPTCVVLDDVAACFPGSGAARMGMRGYVGCRLDSVDGSPLGLLFVLFRDAVPKPDFVTNIVQIFAARAGSELERQLSDARIREQASLLDQAKDAILVHDAAGRISYWNKGAERLYGMSAQEVLGTPVHRLFCEDAGRYQAISARLAERDEWQGELVRTRKDGSVMILELNSTLVRDGHGRPGSVLSIISDITRRKLAEHEVGKLAFTDQLTGLPNRPKLEQALHDFLERGAAAAAHGALLWIDLDSLKSLNDTRGHAIGDLMLRQTGRRIASCVGPGNVAARFGGDEFVVLMTEPGDQPGAAEHLASKLLLSLRQPYDLDGHPHAASASLGIACFRCGQDAVAEIFQRADIAMYEAKAAGRNTVRLFDTRMQKSLHARVELENDLRTALRDNALCLVYQPQVSAAGQVTGVEALLRWTHPVRGPISPAEFIPVAESSGLILACGAWVLEEACKQLKDWESSPATRSLSIAVNVSAHQVRHAGFVDQVKDALSRTGADPRRLKLELTESSLVDDTEETVDKMQALKAVGTSFSLDDFGTGFSSLSYLRRLPLDQLKIDRSFVNDIAADTNAAVITRSIIALGRSLGLDVVAEGVENHYQRHFLAMHGCTTYQGFLFSKPLRVDALEAFIAAAASPRVA